MKITDLFIRRPVLALVVNLVIVIAGLQAIRTLNVRQYPRSENAAVTVTTVYVGASAEPGARLHHHAAGARHRRRRRHRLHRVAEHARPLHHQRPPQAQLRRHQGAGRDQLQGGPGAPRPAARGRGAGHQHRVGRQPVRLGLPELHLRHPASRTRSPTTWCASSSRACPPSRACSAPTSSAPAPSPCASGSSPTGWRRSTSARPRCARRWPPTTSWPRSAGPRARSSRST